MKRAILLTGCLSLAGGPVLAADGPYVGLEGGGLFLNDADYVGTGPSAGSRFTAEHDTGFAAGAMVGYQYGTMRGELEFAYRQNEWDDITNAFVAGTGSVGSFQAAGVAVDGETKVLSAMLNGYVDFDLGGPMTPYLMAGIGGANVELDSIRVTSGGVTITASDEDDTVLAYQAGAGVVFGLNEAVSISLDYRYFGTTDPEFSDVEGEYSSHNLMAGVRFHY